MKASLLFWFLCALVLSITVKAQLVNEKASLNYSTLKNKYSKKSSEFTAFKPSFVGNDSLTPGALSLLSYRKKNYSLVVNPAFDLHLGYQNKDKNSIENHSFGIALSAKLKKWSFGFTYLNVNRKLMQYQNQFVSNNRVLPGIGVSRGVEALSADYFSSFINYKINTVLALEFGFGRNYIGDGYRSLLLSDNNSASPYLKITTSFWKLQYTNLFSSHQNIYNVEGISSLYEKKYTATHFLDWKVNKWLSIGLFETIIWQAEEQNYTRGFDVNYLNPVIFYRPVEFSLGSSDNALVGANIKITPVENYILYSQIIFDEFLLDELRADVNQLRSPDQDIKSGWWANKYGIQIGLRTFDFLKIKGLQTRVELNLVRPYTYAHSSPTQSYSSYNLSLAHPLGANFHELASIITYEKDNWFAKIQFNQSRQGRSPLGLNVGDNIQLSNVSRYKEYENFLTQGIPVITQYAEFNLGYVLDRNTQTSLSFNIIWREQKVENVTLINNAIYLSLKTSLYNQYWDY